MFFLPSVGTALRNLCRVRRQLLDTIARHRIGAIAISFRLTLWPRIEPLTTFHEGYSMLFLL